MRYRKRPVVIEAIQYTGRNRDEILDFIGDAFDSYRQRSYEQSTGNRGRILFIKTLEGVMEASVGDFIIRGIDGEFYPCKPDIFKKTYEIV